MPESTIKIRLPASDVKKAAALRDKKVYLLGTAHISKNSAKKVRESVATLLPDIVCLELDKERFGRMVAELSQKDKGASGEGGEFPYSGVRVKANIFTLEGILGRLQKKLGDYYNIMPGVEMGEGFQAAKDYKIPIGLIDRPIKVTMSRALNEMSFGEKLRLGVSLLGSGVALSVPGGKGMDALSTVSGGEKINLASLEKGEGIDEVMKVMKENFPSIYKALVAERDEYMARNISHISKNKADVVLVVVGAGHIPGMKKILETKGVAITVL